MEGSQQFDMNREYWDYCDDQSRHIDFYNTPTPPLPNQMEEENTQMSFCPDKIIELMDENEEKEEKKRISPKLENASDIYQFLPVDRQTMNKTISHTHK